jgi:pyruvate formate lyase activating enzyme
MKIGGIQKTSLLDYPDTLSAIIWTTDCNFRCPFCYNKHLVFGETTLISEDEVISFLKKRKKMLEGLVISGGEPLLQDDLADFIKKVKKLGYKIKIDTNGTFPEKIKELLDKKLLDYISMDVKAPKKKYQKLSGVKVDIKKIESSVEIIKNEAPDYEFRTTVIPNLLEKKDILEIAKWLEGSSKYYLQQLKSDTPLISKEISDLNPYSKEELLEVLDEIKPFFKICELRGV